MIVLQSENENKMRATSDKDIIAWENRREIRSISFDTVLR